MKALILIISLLFSLCLQAQTGAEHYALAKQYEEVANNDHNMKSKSAFQDAIKAYDKAIEAEPTNYKYYISRSDVKVMFVHKYADQDLAMVKITPLTAAEIEGLIKSAETDLYKAKELKSGLDIESELKMLNEINQELKIAN